MKQEEVILVDRNDAETGVAGKMEAHELGLLHRAFSIFVFNSRGEMLLQQRALHKYHSGGLWTNSCCSHPRPGEAIADAADRRLKEELGFSIPLEKVFDFVYRAEFSNGLTEHEFDHVWVGEYEGPVDFNTEEVMAVGYRDMRSIASSLVFDPDQYTEWFRLAFPRIEAWWKDRYRSKVA